MAISLTPWLFLGRRDAVFGGSVAFSIATIAIWPDSLARCLSLARSPFTAFPFQRSGVRHLMHNTPISLYTRVMLRQWMDLQSDHRFSMLTLTSIVLGQGRLVWI